MSKWVISVSAVCILRLANKEDVMSTEDWKDRGEEIMGALRHNVMLTEKNDKKERKEGSDC